MAVPRNQRLRKQAAKANKRKAAVAEKLAASRRELAITKPRHIDLAASPLADCLVTDTLEREGRALVSRKLSLGRYAVASFHIDFWCLGLRGVFFDIVEGEDYPEFLAAEEAETPMRAAEPGYARKLVHDAAAYGQANGFPPPADLADFERLFGEETSDATFAFGDEGRPHFVIAPDDSPRFERYVLDTLDLKFGPNGYFVTYPLEEDDDVVMPPSR